MKQLRICLLMAAVLCLVSGGFRVRAQAQQPPATTIKAEVALVNVVFSAVDEHNRPFPGLAADNFMVFEDGQRQDIQYFADNYDRTLRNAQAWERKLEAQQDAKQTLAAQQTRY